MKLDQYGKILQLVLRREQRERDTEWGLGRDTKIENERSHIKKDVRSHQQF